MFQGAFCAHHLSSWSSRVRIWLQVLPKRERSFLPMTTSCFCNSNMMSFFFLFLFKTRQLFTSCLKLPNPLFPGHVFSSITHPLAAALCVVQAQLNVQLCGELVQLKNYLAEVMQLPQNVKPQPRVLSEEVEWSCRLVDPGNTANPVKAL